MKRILCLSLLAWPLLATAQVAEPRGVFGSSGGTATGGVYTLTDTTGQCSVNQASSANYAVADGFWPEPGETLPVSGTLNLSVKAGQTAALPLLKLLLLATDPNGETLRVAAVDTASTNGGGGSAGPPGSRFTLAS